MQISEICILGENSAISIGPQSLPVTCLVRHSAASLGGLWIRYIMHAPPFGKPKHRTQLNVGDRKVQSAESVGLFASQRGLSPRQGTSFLRQSTRQLLILTSNLFVSGTSTSRWGRR